MEAKAAKVYKDLVWQDPDRMSGTPCFYGTRVPISHLFEHIEGGYSLDYFCEHFHIERNQAVGVLEAAQDGLLDKLGTAA